ncbi:MAG: hypothetical protein ACLTSX_13685 [Collinsella sp.]
MSALPARHHAGITLAIGWLGEPAVSAVLEAPRYLSWGFPEATVYPICVAVELLHRDHPCTWWSSELIRKSLRHLRHREVRPLHRRPPARVLPHHLPDHGHLQRHHRRLCACSAMTRPMRHEVYTGEEIKLLIDESHGKAASIDRGKHGPSV